MLLSLSFCACGEAENTSKATENNTNTQVIVNSEIDSETEEFTNYVVGEWKSENSSIIFSDNNTCEYEGVIYDWELVGKVFLEYELSVDGNVKYIFMESTTGKSFNLFTAKIHERTGEITTDSIISSFTKIVEE